MKTQHTQTQPTGEPRDLPTRTRGHRVTLADVEAIAELCAERLNEREATAKLGIPYKTWMNWKTRNRNNEAYDDALTRIRANKLAGHIENIKAAERGSSPHERADWRASAHLLKIADRERFGDSPAVEVNTTQIDVYAQLGLDVTKLLGQAYAKQQAIDAPKQLPETTGSETAQKETP
jgi:hypothetical protein